VPQLAVIGNVCIDRVDGSDPRPGGCPSFGVLALCLLAHDGVVVTRCAPADRELFEPFLTAFGVPVTLLDASTTSAFALDYEDETRRMTIEAVGDSWTPADVELISRDTEWAHVAPLTRSDFPPATLAALASGGRRVSYDGQGLVRVPQVGPMRVDASFDRGLLASLRTLKLAEDEAEIIAGGELHAGIVDDLGVPVVLHTLGSRGAVVYERGRRTHVPAAWPVLGVETTGAGDLFMVAYVAACSDGAVPVEATRVGSELVARVLEDRKSEDRESSGWSSAEP
jgi:sugar/nucleoside kinase (ribokinase family)